MSGSLDPGVLTWLDGLTIILFPGFISLPEVIFSLISALLRFLIFRCILWIGVKFEVKLIFLANALANSKAYPEYLTDKLTLSFLRELYIPEEEWQQSIEKVKEVWLQSDAMWSLFK